MPKKMEEVLNELSKHAWVVREHAHIIGNTRVGCALLTSNGKIFAGCNVEHRFRCHDVHAEINTLTSMISAGEKHACVILVVAERERFTPCGGCMDWIMQFGGPEATVAFQNAPSAPFSIHRAGELMPHYPA